jgi:hypothetical protein
LSTTLSTVLWWYFWTYSSSSSITVAPYRPNASSVCHTHAWLLLHSVGLQ